jgi:hypothetical protein
MAGLQPEDFSNLTYNVYEAYQKDPKQDLLVRFPKLKALPSFASYGHGDRNYIIRYIIYLYDINSPVRFYDDLDKQKIEAAILAGYETNSKGSFKDARIKKVLENEDDEVLSMIGDYLISLRNRTYASIRANEHTYYENLRSIFNKSVYKDAKQELDALVVKEKLLDLNEKIEQRLEAKSNELWGKDEDLAKKLDNKFSGMITPETMAGK